MLTSQGKRFLSGAVFLPLFILLVTIGNTFHFFILVAGAALLGLGEFFSLRADSIPAGLRLFGYLWSLLIVFAAYTGDFSYLTGSVAAGVIISLLIRLMKSGDIRRVIDEAGFLYLGVFYVVFLLSFLVLVRGISHGKLWILLLFFITWAGDTSAYYSGLSWGKRKLYPEISPKKSIEGLAGGFLGGVAASIISKLTFFSLLSFADSLLVAAVIGVMGPLGDLSESMLKRSCGVKDSGGIIPGHGGILDRMDSILFSAPFVYYFAVIRYGGQL